MLAHLLYLHHTYDSGNFIDIGTCKRFLIIVQWLKGDAPSV